MKTIGMVLVVLGILVIAGQVVSVVFLMSHGLPPQSGTLGAMLIGAVLLVPGIMLMRAARLRATTSADTEDAPRLQD